MYMWIVRDRAEDLSQLGVDVVVASARLTRLASRNVSALPHAAMRLLGRLDELGPTRISDLAKADRCSQPTMSTLVQRQEEKGWVRREADPADSRASLISLTGRPRRAERARHEAGAAIADRLRQLPADRPRNPPRRGRRHAQILTLEYTGGQPR